MVDITKYEKLKNMMKKLDEVDNKDIEDIDLGEISSIQTQNREIRVLAEEDEWDEKEVIVQKKKTGTGDEYKFYIEEI